MATSANKRYPSSQAPHHKDGAGTAGTAADDTSGNANSKAATATPTPSRSTSKQSRQSRKSNQSVSPYRERISLIRRGLPGPVGNDDDPYEEFEAWKADNNGLVVVGTSSLKSMKQRQSLL